MKETKVRSCNTISVRHGCRFVPRFQRALLKNVSRTHGENEKATVGTQRRTAREREREIERERQRERQRETERKQKGDRRRAKEGT